MAACSACHAQFGPKFREYICSRCQSGFCAGHLIAIEHAKLHSKLMPALSGGQGLCLQCILDVWNKTDSDLAASRPQGIAGRTRKNLSGAWSAIAGWLSSEPKRTSLIRLDDAAFESINSARALAVLRHQKDVTREDVIADLTQFARVYAVSQGRDTERSFALEDVYRLVDWMRSHPKFPSWAHGVTWSIIESSPSYMAHVMDIWHVAKTAIAFSNPVTAAATVVYQVGDRAVDQVKGKGIALTAYDAVKDKVGLNVNMKMAVFSFLGGLFVMQLLKRSE